MDTSSFGEFLLRKARRDPPGADDIAKAFSQ
jgi:hypothetical protein